MGFPRAYTRCVRNVLGILFIAGVALNVFNSFSTSQFYSSRIPSFHYSIPSPEGTDEVSVNSKSTKPINKQGENATKSNYLPKENEIENGMTKENGKQVDTPHIKQAMREKTTALDPIISKKRHQSNGIKLLKTVQENSEKASPNYPLIENKAYTIKGRKIVEAKPNQDVHSGVTLSGKVQKELTRKNVTQKKEDFASKKPAYKYDDIIDKTRKSNTIWKNDEKCDKFRVHFAKEGMLPVCALASFPGSGNTWTRKLIEQASGIYTGSIYNDQELYVHGYYGERENYKAGTTIAQKTHDCGDSHIIDFNKTAILLLRNPYRALLSFHHYLFAGHTGLAPITNYRRHDWSTFVHIQARSWLERAVNWTKQADPERLTVIHYEELQVDPVPSLTRVLEERGFVWDQKRLECFKRSKSYKTFKRKEEYIPENLEIFRAADRDKIDRAIRYVDYLLRKKGKAPLPLHLYEYYNGTEFTHLTRVRCFDEESIAECDNRVDNLNHIRNRKLIKLKGERDADDEQKINAKKPLPSIVKLKVPPNTAFRSLFSAFITNIKRDPMDLMLQQPDSRNLLTKNLKLETDGYPEASSLARDFKGHTQDD